MPWCERISVRSAWKQSGWFVLVLAVALGACAQPSPPPGGPRDLEPPRLDSTRPEQRAILEKWAGPVIFRFDETLGERGVTPDGVLVSPETGRPLLKRSGSTLEVEIEGGWKGNTVYRVIVMPGIQDRFGNARREPIELVFSTGPQLLPTAIGGIVTDRITGRPLAEMRVVALSFPDSVPHATVTDTTGFFGLRFLPVGRYTVRAFEDRNRNKQMDAAEKQAQTSVVVGTVRDTQAVQLVLLLPDTSPARIVRAEVRDSLDVRLFFDDFLDAERPLAEGATANLFQMPDSTQLAASLSTVRAHETARRAQAAAADTTGARVAAPPPTVQGDTTPRPGQELVLVPTRPLQPRTRYRVEVRGVVNINGLPTGGGASSFTTPAPPAARDTTAIRRDSSSLRH